MSKVNCGLSGRLSQSISCWNEKRRSAKRGKVWLSRLISEPAAQVKYKYFASLLSGIKRKKTTVHLKEEGSECTVVCSASRWWSIPAQLAHGQSCQKESISLSEHLFFATVLATVAPFDGVCTWIMLSWFQKQLNLIELSIYNRKLTFIVLVKDIFLCVQQLQHFFSATIPAIKAI